jgi:phosphoribosylamine--glycine ligase
MKDGKVNVLLIGGGGREHALGERLARSERLGDLWVTHPANPGLAAIGHAVDVPVDIREIYRLQQFCRHKDIGLVVIGPEDPLAEGYADALGTDRCLVFGPCKDAARLEADKAWAKQLMRGAAIPTGEARVFDNAESATTYLRSREENQVIKAAGLAKGKGVIVPETPEEGLAAIEEMMVAGVFGDAGRRVVIEERLEGPEASVLALVDGRTVYVLEPCQDHKRIGEGDTGPNTGGMGAYCPTPVIDDEMMARIQSDILVPTVDALRREGIDYRGVLYAGIMLTPAGPKVLEFNVRFGDPECQPLMARLESDLLELMLATAERRLHEADVRWTPGAACCVVLASEGYPEKPITGREVTGLPEAAALPGVLIHHAGTKIASGKVVTAGGRVLGVTGLGEDLAKAQKLAYEACDLIHFEGKTLRRDIGARALPV